MPPRKTESVRPSSGMRIVKFTALASVLKKTYIKEGRYVFKDPLELTRNVSILLAGCEGVDLAFGLGKDIRSQARIANEEMMKLASVIELRSLIELDRKVNIFPTKQNPHDWSRTSEGRDFYESRFIFYINYFLNNILYLSDKSNPAHHLLKNVKPIGTEDILYIRFKVNGMTVAGQGNSLLRLLSLRFKDDTFWPRNKKITRQFKDIPSEAKLILRAWSLINYGYYQEAILIAFSVLDAKIQDLIKKRIGLLGLINDNEINEYLRGIYQRRLDFMLNFVLACLDRHSVRELDPALFKKLEKLNNKRNRIIHKGEEADKAEAIGALETVIRLLVYLNEKHNGKFDILKSFISQDRLFLFS